MNLPTDVLLSSIIILDRILINYKMSNITNEQANKQSQTIKGEGDGESVRIYAETFGKDKDFFG